MDARQRKNGKRSASNYGDAYFLDANVLMYAAGAEHPLRKPCRGALRRAVDLRIRLLTDAEVLEEILHRYFSIDRPDAAQIVYRAATDLCDDVLAVGEQHTTRALELLLHNPGMSPRDAIHVATIEAAGNPRLLSTDRDFDAIPSVQRIDPAEFAR